MLQKMRKLVPIFGVDHKVQTAGILRYLRDRPALFVGTGVHRRVCLYLLFYRIPGIPDRLLHIVGGDRGIFRQALHDGVGHLIDLDNIL